MSSPGAKASAPKLGSIQLRNNLLLAGGYFSLAFAVFQVSGIWWPPKAISYLGGPAEFSIKRPLLYAALCLVLGAIVAVFGLYALSGAGKIRRLPLLRTGLITIAGIYLLRGLLIIPQTLFVVKHPELIRFLIFSLISLCVGAVHAGGVVQLYRHGRPGEAPFS